MTIAMQMKRDKTPDIFIPFEKSCDVSTYSPKKIETPKYGDSKRGYFYMTKNGAIKPIPPCPMFVG